MCNTTHREKCFVCIKHVASVPRSLSGLHAWCTMQERVNMCLRAFSLTTGAWTKPRGLTRLHCSCQAETRVLNWPTLDPAFFSTVPFLAALLLLLLSDYYNGNWIHALTQVLVIHLLMVHSRLRTIFPSISAEQAAAERSFLKVSQDQAVAFNWMKKVKTHNCTHAHADQWLFTCTVLQQKGQRIIYIERKQKTNIVWLSLFSVTCSLGLYGSLMTFPLFVSVRLVSTTTSSSTLSSLIVKTHRLLNLPQNKCTKQACQALQFYVCGATPDNLTPFIENRFETRNTETANV